MPDVEQSLWHEAAIFQGFPNTPEADDTLRKSALRPLLSWQFLIGGVCSAPRVSQRRGHPRAGGA
jgi:hypothetical protein